MLSHSRKLDTEKQIALFLDAHPERAEHGVLERWRAVRDSFVPHAEAVWTGDTALQYAATWAQDGGIIWTEHDPFGKRLSALTGIPFFGAGGLAPNGQSIVTYTGKVCIASWRANGTSLNLQDRWHRNLITSMWPTAIYYDQTLGRTHRRGQQAPVVTCDIPISCREQLAGFTRAAEEDAAFHADLLAIPSRLIGQPTRADKITQRGHAWDQLKR
jgi:hypothetical protein